MSLQGIVDREKVKCVVVQAGRDIVPKNNRSREAVQGFIQAVAEARDCSVFQDVADTSRWYSLTPNQPVEGQLPPRLVIEYINGGNSYVARIELNGRVISAPNDYSAKEQVLHNLGNPSGAVRTRKSSGRYRAVEDESGFYEL